MSIALLIPARFLVPTAPTTPMRGVRLTTAEGAIPGGMLGTRKSLMTVLMLLRVSWRKQAHASLHAGGAKINTGC